MPSLMASSSPPQLDSQGDTAFASMIGELCRPHFFLTIPLPTGAGFPQAEPSGNITKI